MSCLSVYLLDIRYYFIQSSMRKKISTIKIGHNKINDIHPRIANKSETKYSYLIKGCLIEDKVRWHKASQEDCCRGPPSLCFVTDNTLIQMYFSNRNIIILNSILIDC